MDVETRQETGTYIDFRVEKQSLTYLDRFLKLKCASDLIELKLFPNVKEISESFAMLEAIKQHVPGAFDNLGNSDFTKVYVVGDGSTPRTGALVAFTSAWSVVSIDPKLSPKQQYSRIKRLKLIKDKVGSAKFKSPKPYIILMPHAHVNFRQIRESFPLSEGNCKAIISMPCCGYAKAAGEHDWADGSYEDLKVISPMRKTMRKIYVWTKRDMFSMTPKK